MPKDIKKRFIRAKDLNYIVDESPAVKGSMNVNKTPIEILTNRINVLVKTCNRMTLQMQKLYSQSEDEEKILDTLLARDSRDVSESTIEVVKDEEAVARQAAEEAVRIAQREAADEIEEMKKIAHEEVERMKTLTKEEIETGRVLAARETKLATEKIAANEKIAKQEYRVFDLQRKSFTNEALAIRKTKEMALAELEAVKSERDALSNERASIADQRDAWQKTFSSQNSQLVSAEKDFKALSKRLRSWKIAIPIFSILAFGAGDALNLFQYLASFF